MHRAIVSAALFATLSACSGGENGPSKPAASEVTLELIAFKPETLEVKAGATVVWNQKDTAAHTVTSGTVVQATAGVDVRPDGKFDSGTLQSGERFTFTFDQPGNYTYYCALHPATMRGEVRVS